MVSWSERAQDLRYTLDDVRDLGWRRTLFRVGWEAKARSGWFRFKDRLARSEASPPALRLGFFKGAKDLTWVEPWLRADPGVTQRANDAGKGRIRCFSRWFADFGQDPDWFLEPRRGHRYRPQDHWAKALRGARACDVKLCWELGRFPHAYDLGRAAVLAAPDDQQRFAKTFWSHVESFAAQNPVGFGVHSHSGQEIVVRCVALLFAAETFHSLGLATERDLGRLSELFYASAHHVEVYIDFARYAVYNNHLIAEAFGLLFFAELFPHANESARWRRYGGELLEEAVRSQFAADGGYIQNSHNYHRIALQYLVWCNVLWRNAGVPSPSSVMVAMDRSVDFLLAHQNAADGSLPNFGSNDGGLPSLLTSCDYTDFRPTILSACAALNRDSPYPAGPWDEEAGWFFGSIPRGNSRPEPTGCASFPVSGYHVLRMSPDTFASFRCGTIRDRFHQLDMLSVDLYWRGQNVLVDPGSFQYNGAPAWHRHFVGTGAHNTIKVDDEEQMVLFRQFRMLYPTEARLIFASEFLGGGIARGEHLGYNRLPDGVTHEREVALFGSEEPGLVVIDDLRGSAPHTARLHWLSAVPARPDQHRMILDAHEELQLVVCDLSVGQFMPLDVVSGRADPPRGWLSRYYGEKAPAWSISAALRFSGTIRVATLVFPRSSTITFGSEASELVVAGRGGAQRLRLHDRILLERMQ